MRRLSLLVFALAAQLVAAGAGLAATPPAGKAVGVTPSASDVVKQSTRTLVVGSDVAMGDRIVTTRTGQVQLVFNDDTHLVVGPNSSLLLESYLLRSDKSVGQFAIDALGGSFRFITGKSDHGAYTIRTPTGTIGVRGTAFDFIVEPNRPIVPGHLGGTSVALFRGAVQMCDNAGKCVTLTRTCDLGAMTRVEAFTIGHQQAADAGVRARFRYISSQRPLMQPFWIEESRLCYILNSSNSIVAPGSNGRVHCTTKPGAGRSAAAGTTTCN